MLFCVFCGDSLQLGQESRQSSGLSRFQLTTPVKRPGRRTGAALVFTSLSGTPSSPAASRARYLGSPRKPLHHELVRPEPAAFGCRAVPDFAHHAAGRSSSGCPPVGGPPSGGWIAGSVPVGSRNSPASLVAQGSGRRRGVLTAFSSCSRSVALRSELAAAAALPVIPTVGAG